MSVNQRFRGRECELGAKSCKRIWALDLIRLCDKLDMNLKAQPGSLLAQKNERQLGPQSSVLQTFVCFRTTWDKAPGSYSDRAWVRLTRSLRITGADPQAGKRQGLEYF